ncbi:sensor domain-containing diguanylate cyclase [Brevibacillus daliensis]|uniref:sensor domain-containing diguanylate cyclase n=1 Tax=Brevibacillus daliensis TaxID=2892995 RepID=UPI001E2A01C1|nr:sensor domain-containing diguanylate cyclase [Brevibacillus daliensis]
MALQTRAQTGKLEKIVDGIVPFFLPSWPKQVPGLLFFYTPERDLLSSYLLGEESGQLSSNILIECSFVIQKELDQVLLTNQSVMVDGDDRTLSIGNFKCMLQPLAPENGMVHAVAGILIMEEDAYPYIHTFGEMLKGLYNMGYKGFLQRMVERVIDEAIKFHEPELFMKAVVQHLHETIGIAHCSLIRLDGRGFLLPQERFSTEDKSFAESSLYHVLPRFVHQKIERLTTADNKLAFYPIYYNEKPIAALILHIDETEEATLDGLDLLLLQMTGEQIRSQMHRTLHIHEILRESQKKELIYQLTKKIHASIDVHDVLEGVVGSINQLYPYFSTELHLTMELQTTLPVKTFTVHKELNQVSQQAYFEGRLTTGREDKEGRLETLVAAPLLGKQGIYGILLLKTTEMINLSVNESEYISVLAETAGIAFENAQLYQQSRNKIRELRLINEMAQQINRSLNMMDILEFVTKMLHMTFDAEYAAILQKLSDGEHMQIVSSSKSEHIGQIIPISSTPIAEIFMEKQRILLSNENFLHEPHPLFTYSSVMGVHMHQDSEVSGLLLVADTKPNFFSYDEYKLLELFGQHTSLAINNALLLSEVERLVITDNLTGLYTRRYLNENVKKSLESEEQGSLILVDIDYFKNINDTYGHLVGDEILHKVSSVIKTCIRDSDIPARWGGEEIAIYLPNVDITIASKIAERIRNRVELESNPKVTVSGGVAMWSKSLEINKTAEELFHDADVALYRAKQGGRNQVRHS